VLPVQLIEAMPGAGITTSPAAAFFFTGTRPQGMKRSET